MITSDTIYFGCRDGKVYALDRVKGNMIWSFKDNPPWWIISSPILYNDIIYIGTDNYSIYGLDFINGSVKESFKTECWVMSSPCLSECILYVGCGEKEKK